MRGATAASSMCWPSRRFQSTLPMRGATCGPHCNASAYKFQSTLPMRGATQGLLQGLGEDDISIHAPHAGSDNGITEDAEKASLFQSTLPMRGATSRESVHHVHDHRNFNPRSPCGERPAHFTHYWVGPRFQSTLPMRGATRR